MIRINFSIIITAIVLAGCNPPAEVVSPSPDPTPVVDIDTSIEAAQDGSTVIFNEPLSAPLEISGFKCALGTCLFNKLELKHALYDTEAASPYQNAVIRIQGTQDSGHGVVIKAGTTLTQLWLRGFDNSVLFEENVYVQTISIDGEGTGFSDADATTDHLLANAGEGDRCQSNSTTTELCTGYNQFSSSWEYYGNVELQTLEVTANQNTVDLRYGKTATSHLNTNPTALAYISNFGGGQAGFIQAINVTANGNTLYLCGRDIGSITISGNNNTIHVDSMDNLQFAPVYGGDSVATQASTSFVTTECGTNAIRP